MERTLSAVTQRIYREKRLYNPYFWPLFLNIHIEKLHLFVFIVVFLSNLLGPFCRPLGILKTSLFSFFSFTLPYFEK